jgi:hypothetical protein
MKTHLGGISMKLSNLEHCENTKTHRFLPLIELPDIDGASSIRTLEQPQRNDALSALCEFGPHKFCSCSECRVRRAAPQHQDSGLEVGFGPFASPGSKRQRT